MKNYAIFTAAFALLFSTTVAPLHGQPADEKKGFLGGKLKLPSIPKPTNPFKRKPTAGSDGDRIDGNDMGAPLPTARATPRPASRNNNNPATANNDEHNFDAQPEPFYPPPTTGLELLGGVSTNLPPSRPLSTRTNETGIAIQAGTMQTSGTTPAATTTATTSGTMPSTGATRPTVNPEFARTDFAPPRPEIEPEAAILEAYTAAVQLGTLERYDEAVDALTDFVKNHPHSLLSQRALYLVAIYAKENVRRQTAAVTLIRNHQGSKYLSALNTRDAEIFDRATVIAKGTAAASAQPANAMSDVDFTADSEPPSTSPASTAGAPDVDKLARAQELALNSASIQNKLALAEAYAEAAQYQRAESLLIELLPVTSTTPLAPSVLDLLGKCRMELGETDEARRDLDRIVRQYPRYENMRRVRLNIAILSERVGNNAKAQTEYQAVIDTGSSPESKDAATRLAALKKRTATAK